MFRPKPVSRSKPIALMAAMVFFALLRSGPAQQPAGESETQMRKAAQLQLIDAQFELRLRELELKLAELAESEMKVEVEKYELHVQQIKTMEAVRPAAIGSAHDAALVEKELKQAVIRLQMRSTETEVARLRVKLARERLDTMEDSHDNTEEKPTAIRMEIVEGLDVVLIRGSKEGVEKVRAIIESVEKQKR